MNKALLNRRLRQVHLWLGIAIGAQVGLWLISGLFMTWFPIETVRGDHLRSEKAPSAILWSQSDIDLATAISLTDQQIEKATAIMLNGEPVWQLDHENGSILISAASGNIISPLVENSAKEIASGVYIGRGAFQSALLLENPPREYGRPGPAWRIEFGPQDRASFYVDASTGDVRAVRTLLWRTFDFMWGLHIMDWSTRENFNSWWIKMTASLAVLFFLAGLGLVSLRVSRMLKKNSRQDKPHA